MVTKKAIRYVLFIIGISLSLIFLFPIALLAINSFKSLKEIYVNFFSLPKHLALINYSTAFDKLDYVKSITNSFVITLVATILLTVFSSMAAWVLVRYKSKTSVFLFMLFASAMLIPFQCVMLPLVSLMDKLHMMNPPGLIFMYLGFGGSMSILLFHGFIKNIPLELEEAATIDGAGFFRTFFQVVFPLLKSTTVTVAIINVMWIWNDFLLPSLMINKQGWQTLPLKTYLFFGQFSKRWDLATAGILMVIIPVIIFYLICQKYIVEGITDGAIK